MKKEVITVKASYKTLATIKNVLVKVPGANDKYMKFIREHEMLVDGKSVNIPDHYRRGDLFNGRFLTRHFYIGAEGITEYPQQLIATVDLVEKIDERGSFLILDIHPSGEKPEYKLAIGCPTGDFKIPGTDKWVDFKKI